MTICSASTRQNKCFQNKHDINLQSLRKLLFNACIAWLLISFFALLKWTLWCSEEFLGLGKLIKNIFRYYTCGRQLTRTFPAEF